MSGSSEGCTRCGTCCRKGGPVLHGQDRGLFTPGPDKARTLDTSQVLTLRQGEMVLDPVSGEVVRLKAEAVKIKGRTAADWTCRFFLDQDNTCGLYGQHPLQCRVLDCRDTSALAAVYQNDRLSRRDVLPEGHALLDLVDMHERLAPAGRAVDLALRLAAHFAQIGASGQAAPEEQAELTSILARILASDRDLRRLAVERAGLDPEDLDFLFGRSLAEVLAPIAAQSRGPFDCQEHSTCNKDE